MGELLRKCKETETNTKKPARRGIEEVVWECRGISAENNCPQEMRENTIGVLKRYFQNRNLGEKKQQAIYI